MKVPNQSPPVVRYTTSNLTISSQLNSDDANVVGLRNTSTSSSGNSSINSFTPSAACVGVGIVNNRVCLKVPVVGNVCIPVPVGLPSVGAQACVSVCTKWGVPTGACVSVRVNNTQVARQCFGWC
jgi:tetrahydromethanopterin S-methyltransferase subunit H